MGMMNNFLVFLFSILFAFPDFFIRLPFVNLRFSDIVIYLFLVLNFQKVFKKSLYRPRIVYFILMVLIMIASTSIIANIILVGNIDFISKYEFFKFLGSIPYVFGLSLIFSNKSYLKTFLRGFAIGGLAYFVLFLLNFSQLTQENVFAYYQVKSASSFDSLNPNAVAVLASIFAWINLYSYFYFRKFIYLVISLFLFMIPFLTLSRAMSIGIIVGFFFFVILYRGKNLKFYVLLAVIVLFVIYVLYDIFINKLGGEVLKSALSIDLKSGQGFSGRFDTWREALVLIEKSPILGYGLGTEEVLYARLFGGKMSHNIFLHYTIELGILGVILFIILLVYILYGNLKTTFQKLDNKNLVRFSFVLSFIIADFAQQLLYLNKYSFLVLIFASRRLDKE